MLFLASFVASINCSLLMAASLSSFDTSAVAAAYANTPAVNAARANTINPIGFALIATFKAICLAVANLAASPNLRIAITPFAKSLNPLVNANAPPTLCNVSSNASDSVPNKSIAPSAATNPPANPVTASIPAVNFCSKSKLSNCNSTFFISVCNPCISLDTLSNSFVPICSSLRWAINSSILFSIPSIVLVASPVSTVTSITIFSLTAIL